MDGQEALLARVADLAQFPDDRARLAELRDVARRMRRDSEALLLLCGADPGVHRGTPHTVPAVLGDAVALVDEPSRVEVRSAPAATLASSSRAGATVVLMRAHSQPRRYLSNSLSYYPPVVGLPSTESGGGADGPSRID